VEQSISNLVAFGPSLNLNRIFNKISVSIRDWALLNYSQEKSFYDCDVTEEILWVALQSTVAPPDGSASDLAPLPRLAVVQCSLHCRHNNYEKKVKLLFC